jgi:hypothetical protein
VHPQIQRTASRQTFASSRVLERDIARFAIAADVADAFMNVDFAMTGGMWVER